MIHATPRVAMLFSFPFKGEAGMGMVSRLSRSHPRFARVRFAPPPLEGEGLQMP